MKYLYVLLAVLITFQLNCGKSTGQAEAEAAKKFAEWEANGIARVKVDEGGDIYLNNKPIPLEE